jgi:hypothetical protein
MSGWCASARDLADLRKMRPPSRFVPSESRKRFILNIVNKHLDEPATESEIVRQRHHYSPVSTILVGGQG